MTSKERVSWMPSVSKLVGVSISALFTYTQLTLTYINKQVGPNDDLYAGIGNIVYRWDSRVSRHCVSMSREGRR